jgi:hypothetical protein
MRVLVACEESQAVCKEFRILGHEAYSCDIIECSGGHPEWHINEDVLGVLNPMTKYDWNNYITFETMDGEEHWIEGKWDMIIAFPPCTHLAVSGAKHFENKRLDGRQRKGVEFFCQFLTADCDRIAIENPVGIISGDYVSKWFPDLAEKYGLPRTFTQKIQPYQFGDPFEKTTCLWLKGVPQLTPTNIVEPPPRQVVKSGKTLPIWYSNCGWNRAKARSKTFPGIAKAMAEQWGGECK